MDRDHCNFHIFYYFYDAMKQEKSLGEFDLDGDRKYRYLRIPEEPLDTKLPYTRDDPEGNADKYREFESTLKSMDFDVEHITSMRKILAAILMLGNVRFKDEGKFAVIETLDEVQKIAKLLSLDEKKFEWALVNYCYVQSGVAEKRKHTSDEARDARDVLASTIYCRLVDWIVNIVNQKFSLGRAVLLVFVFGLLGGAFDLILIAKYLSQRRHPHHLADGHVRLRVLPSQPRRSADD